MFKAVTTVTDTFGSNKAEDMINFFHVREIGPLRVIDGRDLFDIIFADGTITYGIGTEQYNDVRAWALALR